MFRYSPLQQIRSLVSRFLTCWVGDRRGNFAMIFALALVPALVAIGAAIDTSRAYAVRQRMSHALDAAGLAVGTQSGLTQAQMQTLAQSYFDANYPSTANAPAGTVNVSQDGAKINLTVSTDMNTSFLGLVGVNTLEIAQSSQITRMGKKLEIALVLDTTGSMAWSGRMAALKVAAKNLIDTVSSAAANVGDVKIAIVPFAVDVNVGTANSNANWIKWEWTTPKTQTEVCETTGGNGKGKGKGKGGGTEICWYEDTTYSINKNTWLGCVIDRDMDYDVSNALPVASNNATLYPADNENCRPTTLMPLSTDFSALKKKIDSLVAAGNTNTTIGLAWGWNMLTPGAPLSEAAVASDKLDKIIVYMTDGDNTENRFTKTRSAIDARMAAACTAVKADGIMLYTVRLMQGNETLLRNCASDPSMYYSVTAASQLDSVFASIAQAISNLRVSQ